MNILIDYLTISFCFLSFEDLLKKLKLEVTLLQEIKSYYGYEKAYYYGGIKIHYSQERIILDCSGKGCRMLEMLYNNKFDWIEFIYYFLREENSNISRLDIACDDKPKAGEKGILNFSTLTRHTLEDKFICQSKQVRVISKSEQAIYFGAPSSDRRLRIYNKALERGFLDKHWIRAEFQLRDDKALAFFNRCYFDNLTIGELYGAYLLDYLRFTTTANIKGHTERLLTSRWWYKFVNTTKKIKGLTIGGTEYNLHKAEQFFQKGCSSTGKLLLNYYDGDLSKIINCFHGAKLNKEQEFVLKAQKLKDEIERTY